MEVVTECLLHVELKMTKNETVNDERRALAVKGKPKRLVCHFCLKLVIICQCAFYNKTS